jgi:hypothetical protein
MISDHDEEISAFGFWDFKIPKAFRPQLFDCYPLTVQDSIYNSIFISSTDPDKIKIYKSYIRR